MTSTSFVPWLNFAHLIAQFGFFSTSFFCIILIYLTSFCVDRKFGSYKKLVLISPYFGIFFASMEYILVPYVHSFNAGYIYFCTNKLHFLSNTVITWLLELYTALFAVSIEVIAVQFLYRYWAVFNETKLRFFTGCYTLIFVVYSLFFGVIWALGVFYFMDPDEYSTKYMRIEMMERYEIDITKETTKILVAYDENGQVRWLNVSSTLNMTLIMLTQYIIIFYCAIMMHLKMEEKLRAFSTSLRNLHKQMFKTLVLQITAPTVFLFAPVFIVSSLPLLDLQVSLPTGCMSSLFAIYPAMDALIIMYVVEDYHKAVKKIILVVINAITVEDSTCPEGNRSNNANVPAAVNVV